ncbi:MAG: nickel/cobalt efflux protein RcnA [Verrucomicrobiaceae bacterium]|nr:MAG: nickel/cobalt efflux protein RcnA [Verrucomicrobiaceae bacterium]
MNPEHITWLFLPSAVLLGILHGLEPGHSKTMMASFIIATRGTIAQAVLLGISAALSHSLIIWALAAAALRFGREWNAETVEPYLQLFSAVAIVTLAVWMFRRTKAEVNAAHHHHHGAHGHHHDDSLELDTGHGKILLGIHEDGVPPVFQLRVPSGSRLPSPDEVRLITERADGTKRTFPLLSKKGCLESADSIPEPHEFTVVVTLSHGNHSHEVRAVFREDGHHHHELDGDADFQDAHERAHAEDIRRRFAGHSVTTPQIIWFGVTGGLMPCPAAFSVLLICLQLKKVTLGFFMVAAFSLGLALTMVTTGVIAAWSIRHAERRFKGFGEVMRRAPYLSCALMIVIAAVMAWHGWQGLQRH